MSKPPADEPPRLHGTLHALLVLGRVSNLPTVWSNCLAGWWLGGGAYTGGLPALFIGTSLLYIGGMFLNDAFDIEFDVQHRKERPIPSGAIRPTTVWILGFTCLVLGIALLFTISASSGGLGLILTGFIVLYDATHKRISFAPIFMGICRLLLYLVA